MPNAFTLFGELKADTSQFERSLQKSDQELQNLSRSITKQFGEATKLGQATATTARSYERLQETVAKARQRISDYREAESRGLISTRQMVQAIEREEATVSQLNSKLKDASAKMQDFAAQSSKVPAKLQNVGNSIKSAGQSLALYITAPIVAATAGILKVGTDYEKALNTFQAVTKATEGEMKKAADTAKALGADITLPATSAKDAALAMTELAKANFTAADAMDAVKGTLQLAAAGQLDEARAAEITANALNSFKLKATESVRVSDLLAAAANSSSAEVEDVAQAMQQASAVFSSSKIPIEDLTTAIALMANAGIKGGDAGTSLKTFISRLTAPTDNAASAMENLGVKVFDAQGKMRGFPDIIGQFEQSLSKLTDEKKAQALYEIFGSDALRAAQILFTEGTAGFNKIKEAVTQVGAASDLASAKTKGVGGAWDALKSQFETIGITIFEAIQAPLSDALKVAVDFAGQFGDAFGKLSPEIQAAAIAAAAFAASLAPLLIVAGALVSAIGAIAGAASTIGIVIAAIAGIGVALAPVVAWAVALYEAWKVNFGGIRELTAEVASAVKLAWTTAMAALSELTAEATKQISEFWKENGADIMRAVKTVSDFLKMTWQTVLGVINKLWEQHGDQIKGIAAATWSSIKTVVGTGLRIIGDIIKLTAATINGDWSKVWEAVKDIVKAALSAVGTLLTNGAKVIGNIILGFAKMIAGFATQFYESAISLGENLVQGIIDGIARRKGELVGQAQILASTVIGIISQTAIIRSPSKVTTYFGEMIAEGLAVGMENKFQRVTETARSVIDEVLATLSGRARKVDTAAIITGKLGDFKDLLNDLGLIKEITVFDRIDAFFKDGDLAGYIDKIAAGLGMSAKNLERFMLLKIAAQNLEVSGLEVDRSGNTEAAGIGEDFRIPIDVMEQPPELAKRWQNFFSTFRQGMAEMKATLPDIKTSIGENLLDSISQIPDIFASAVSRSDGTIQGFFRSVASGFAQMAKEIIAEMVRIAIMRLILNLTSMFAGASAGASGADAGGATAGNAGSGGHFARGGYTGDGAVNKIAGFVHGKEFVNTARAVRFWGKDFFQSLNNLQMPSMMPSMAGGSSNYNTSTFAPVIQVTVEGGSGSTPYENQLSGNQIANTIADKLMRLQERRK